MKVCPEHDDARLVRAEPAPASRSVAAGRTVQSRSSEQVLHLLPNLMAGPALRRADPTDGLEKRARSCVKAFDHLAHLVRLPQQRLALQKELALERLFRRAPHSINPSASIVASAPRVLRHRGGARASARQGAPHAASDRETSARPAPMNEATRRAHRAEDTQSKHELRQTNARPRMG